MELGMIGMIRFAHSTEAGSIWSAMGLRPGKVFGTLPRLSPTMLKLAMERDPHDILLQPSDITWPDTRVTLGIRLASVENREIVTQSPSIGIVSGVHFTGAIRGVESGIVSDVPPLGVPRLFTAFGENTPDDRATTPFARLWLQTTDVQEPNSGFFIFTHFNALLV